MKNIVAVELRRRQVKEQASKFNNIEALDELREEGHEVLDNPEDKMLWNSIFVSRIAMNIIRRNKENDSYRPRTFVRGIPVTECIRHSCASSNILSQNNISGAMIVARI